jgi:hypothetical protein
LFGGFHFSPLAIIPIAACFVHLVAWREHRALFRAPALWVALLLASAHVAIVARGALAVAEGASGRPHHYFSELALRLHTYFRTLLGGLAGEATLRHFTGSVLPPGLEYLAMLVVLGLFALVWYSPSRESGPARELRSFAIGSVFVAIVLLPFVLAPARAWNLSAVDSERYLFAMLAPFAFVLGVLAEDPTRVRRIAAWGFSLYLLVGPTLRAQHAFWYGGGPDLGAYLLRGGGGYRGWKVVRERRALAWLVRDDVMRHARGVPATILVADYAFHPFHFANVERGYPTVDVFKFGMPHLARERVYFVFFSEGLFAPSDDDALEVVANRKIRHTMLSEFDSVARIRSYVQPNGEPLVELWTGVAR